MHELPITQRILDVVLRHAAANNLTRIVTITLRVGELSELEDEWLQHYFDYLSKDTVAKGAQLKIERVPIVLRCGNCNETVEVTKESMAETACPGCQQTQTFSIESGN